MDNDKTQHTINKLPVVRQVEQEHLKNLLWKMRRVEIGQVHIED